jgi:hypothetical protein
MAERRIGLIPHAISIMRKGQPETCAVFVTDRRTVFVFEDEKQQR